MKNGPSKKDWLMGVIPLFLLFCCYLYCDMAETTTRGIAFWECIFNDTHDTIYNYVYEPVPNTILPNGINSAAYDFLFYIFFAIWDFPLWIFEKITGVSFLNFWITKVYAKSIIIVFLFLSSLVLKKIVTKIADDTLGKWAQFFYIISATVAHVIVVIGNYDIIGVTFILLGTYYYLCNEDNKFIASFAIAATCKMFALFVFIPLLLLRYKKIKDILIRAFLSISLIIIPKCMFVIYNRLIVEPASVSKSADNMNFVGNKIIAHANMVDTKLFLNNGGPISLEEIPLFIIMTLLLWWISWKKKDANNRECIVFSSLGIVIFFLFVDTIPYWSILLLPYIVIYMMMNPSLLYQNAFIESVMMLSYIVYNMLVRLHIYQGRLIFDMLPIYKIRESIIQNYSEPGFDLLVKRLSVVIGISYENICATFLGIFVLALIIFVFSNIRNCNEDSKYEILSIKKVGYIRMGVAIVVAMIPVITIVCRFINGRL